MDQNCRANSISAEESASKILLQSNKKYREWYHIFDFPSAKLLHKLKFHVEIMNTIVPHVATRYCLKTSFYLNLSCAMTRISERTQLCAYHCYQRLRFAKLTRISNTIFIVMRDVQLGLKLSSPAEAALLPFAPLIVFSTRRGQDRNRTRNPKRLRGSFQSILTMSVETGFADVDMMHLPPPFQRCWQESSNSL